MHAEPAGNPLRRTLSAALRGLEEAVTSAPDVSPALVHEVLEYVGDATRAELPLPARLARWLTERTTSEIVAAVQAAREETATWALPGSAQDDGLPFLLLRRDATASLLAALTRWAMARGLAPGELAEVGLLLDALTAFDGELATLVARPHAEALLGERAPLVGVGGWTSSLPEPESTSAAGETLDWDPAMATVTPSDHVVTEYVTRGRCARVVEGFARQDADFADELGQLILAAIDDGEVGFRARRWARQGRAHAAPIRYAGLPQRLLAASTGPTTANPPVRIELGQLTTQSQGMLTATSTDVTLEVYAAMESLSLVELDGVVATATPALGSTERWSVTIARPDRPVRLRIVATDGESIDEELALSAEPTS